MPLRTKIPAPMMFVIPIDAAPKVPISPFNEVPMKFDHFFVWYILSDALKKTELITRKPNLIIKNTLL